MAFRVRSHPAGYPIKPPVDGEELGAHADTHAAAGSDPVTPAAIGAATSIHAAQHASGGADPVTPAAIGAIGVPEGSAQGDILFRNAAGWTRLPAGDAGKFLKTLGAGADPLWDSAVQIASIQQIRHYLGEDFQTTSTTYVVTEGRIHIEFPSGFFEETENGYYRPLIYVTGFVRAHSNMQARLRFDYINKTGALTSVTLQESSPPGSDYHQQLLFHNVTEYLRKYRHAFLALDIRSTNGVAGELHSYSWLGQILDYGEIPYCGETPYPYWGWLK
ncbi:MAG: hypothetical protein AB1374_06030 [Bacillota bacterium]